MWTSLSAISVQSNCASQQLQLVVDNNIHIDYRFFQSAHEESRKVRRMQKAELKEIGRQEALNRGKRLDENGKFTTKPMPVDVADDVQAPQ